jgi:hypothetical protein
VLSVQAGLRTWRDSCIYTGLSVLAVVLPGCVLGDCDGLSDNPRVGDRAHRVFARTPTATNLLQRIEKVHRSAAVAAPQLTTWVTGTDEIPNWDVCKRPSESSLSETGIAHGRTGVLNEPISIMVVVVSKAGKQTVRTCSPAKLPHWALPR